MFSMFGSSYSRYASYHRDSSSDEEEQKSAQFRLAATREEGDRNTALEDALENADAAGGRIALETEADEGMDLDAAVLEQQKDMCVECHDQPATVVCAGCGSDRLCDVCWASLHRSGSRKQHQTTKYASSISSAVNAVKLNASSSPAASSTSGDVVMDESPAPVAVAVSSSSSASAPAASSSTSDPTQERDEIDDIFENEYQRGKAANAAAAASSAPAKSATSNLSDSDDASDDDGSSVSSARGSEAEKRIVLPSGAMNSSITGSINGKLPADWFLQRAKYIPLRLTLEERKFLRLLEATLNVSEYTDKVDIVSNKDKMLRIKEQLRDLCSILSGLVVANDYKLGAALIKDKNFEDNAEFFRTIFELGRRHKVRNPEKMRSTYGKLVFIIQDSINPAIEDLMGFHLHAPLKTVYAKLEACGASACLQDERLMIATGEIKTEDAQGQRRPRPDIDRDIKTKVRMAAAELYCVFARV